MGCGKSHIGRLLAKKSGLKLFDTDSVIEERANSNVAAIFEQYGESKFRASERAVIAALLKDDTCIISLGGGAIVDADTRGLLKEQSHLVWIDAPLDTVWERVKTCKNRPLLNTDHPRATLEKIYEERKPLYEQAHLRVPNDGTHTSQNIQLILDTFAQ